MNLRNHDLPCVHDQGEAGCGKEGAEHEGCMGYLGAYNDMGYWECVEDDCPGGAVVPVVEVQWCNTHNERLHASGRCHVGNLQAVMIVELGEDYPPCVPVTRHMLKVSDDS